MVSNLNFTWINSLSILMSFIPPFTIKGVPISNYSINIVSKELNTTVYALPDGQSAQELTTVTIIGLDQCSFYNICVSAWNDYGQGSHDVFIHNSRLSLLNTESLIFNFSSI